MDLKERLYASLKRGDRRGTDGGSHRTDKRRHKRSSSLVLPPPDVVDETFGFAERHARGNSHRRSLGVRSPDGVSTGDADVFPRENSDQVNANTFPRSNGDSNMRRYLVLSDIDMNKAVGDVTTGDHSRNVASPERASRPRASRGEQVALTRGARSQSLPRYLYSERRPQTEVSDGDVLRQEYIKMRQRLQQLSVNKTKNVQNEKMPTPQSRNSSGSDTGKASSPASKDMTVLKEHLKSLNTELILLQRHLEPPKSSPQRAPREAKEATCKSEEAATQINKADIRNSSGAANLTRYIQVEDLIRVPGPITEHSLLKTLQARFYNGKYYTYCGPVLVVLNPHSSCPGPRALLDAPPACPHLQRLVYTVTRQHAEQGSSQVIILSGVSGSGKTSMSMVLLRRLFEVAGGGHETDSFKHLSAAVTVLRSLSSAATPLSPESSRMGFFLENHIAEGAIYRTKIQCYFLDSSRVVKLQPQEKNYHIFYQMLAGLTQEERVKLHLQSYSVHSLLYLNGGATCLQPARDQQRFEAWRAALSVMGIPFSDVMRVLAAVLLLGNIQLVDGPGLELDIRGNNEVKSVAALLGVSSVTLYRGLSTRTRSARGQVFRSMADANSANAVRDALAKSLFCRTVSAIVKRANSMKRPTSNSTVSSDSNESFSNSVDQNGYSPSNGAVFYKSSPLTSRSSVNQLTNNGSSSQQEGFIGILDMYGFENVQTNHLEQLCINLCSESLQHHYNQHIFRNTLEACAEEGIQSDMDISYHDNTPVIDLLSSKRTGILSLLDSESNLQRMETESFTQKMSVQHKLNPSYYECAAKPSQFGIMHYAGRVDYDSTQLLLTNRDQLPDDIVAIFAKQNCNFGFVSHLFSSELKGIQEIAGSAVAARGISHRICPCPNAENQSGNDGKGSISLDFRNRLDNLLKILSYAKPHFIRCIKTNSAGQADQFEREAVVGQVRAMQLLESTSLYAGGFPHRMRYRNFNSRYRVIINHSPVTREDDRCYDECKMILDHYVKSMEALKTPCNSSSWAIGKKHIFLSELARQQLEGLRDARRHTAAVTVQTAWRRHQCVRNWPSLRIQLDLLRLNRSPVYKQHARHSSQSSTHSSGKTKVRNHLNGGDYITSAEAANHMNHGSGYWSDVPTRQQNGYHHKSANHSSSKSLSGGDQSFYSNRSHSLNRTASLNYSSTHTVSNWNDYRQSNNNEKQKQSSLNRSSSTSRANYSVISKSRDAVDMSNSNSSHYDQRVLQQTAQHYGVDMNKPPPLPPHRQYTVQGNVKCCYPQRRLMRQNYTASGSSGDYTLYRGQEVKVTDMSSRRGFLQVDIGGATVDVPYHITELKTPQPSPNSSCNLPVHGVDI